MGHVNVKFNLLTVILWAMLFGQLSWASDHIDGPVTMTHGVADISDLYVFPTPDKEGRLSLVLNVYPMVPAQGHFSEKVNYVFILRRATMSAAAGKFVTNDETQITCSFKTPHRRSAYSVTCQTSQGLWATAKIAQKTHKGDFRLFAGMASDTFFFNRNWVENSMEKGRLVPPENDNLMDKLNVLSVVIDLEINKIFKNYKGELIAVAAKSITKDRGHTKWRQLDWIGRPEVTNFSLSPGGKPDLRDLYNKEEPFSSSFKFEEEYGNRLFQNIKAHYDPQDKVTNWADDKITKLVSILLDDFIVVAPDMPCGGDHFFEIERSLLEGMSPSSCGGRKLTDDIVDKVLSLYITSELDQIGDGVTQPYRKVKPSFPYLSKPDTSASARIKAWLARKFIN